jgi:hypothetical protein
MISLLIWSCTLVSCSAKSSSFRHLSNRNNRFSLRGVPITQEDIPLVSALYEVTPAIKDRYFFPGHCGGEYVPKVLKRLYGSELFHYDLPELDGLDNIHCPEGPLLQALQLASKLFGAKQSWFLVNGSTSGILSAVLASVQMHQRNTLRLTVRVRGRVACIVLVSWHDI